VDLVFLARVIDWLRAFVNTIINIRVLKKGGIS
jgi:hypothetical protein